MLHNMHPEETQKSQTWSSLVEREKNKWSFLSFWVSENWFPVDFPSARSSCRTLLHSYRLRILELSAIPSDLQVKKGGLVMAWTQKQSWETAKFHGL
jgi:hypothetical protein